MGVEAKFMKMSSNDALEMVKSITKNCMKFLNLALFASRDEFIFRRSSTTLKISIMLFCAEMRGSVRNLRGKLMLSLHV